MPHLSIAAIWRRNLVAHLGIALLPTQMLSLQELHSCRLARLGRTEEHREPDMLRWIVAAPKICCATGSATPFPDRARTGAHEDQLADEIGRCSVISCATMPPIEKPSTSTLSNQGLG